MRALLVASWSLVLVAHAHAEDEREAATRLLAEQVRALNAGDAKAFAKTFSTEAFLIFAGDGALHNPVTFLAARFSVAMK
jgi:hypothetical protein